MLNPQGVGRGLMICKKICENLQGEISVHSDGDGLGSTFSFSYPISGQLND